MGTNSRGERMKTYLIIAALVLWALAIPGINIYHHLDLPKLDPYRVTSHYILKSPFPFVHKEYEIRLENEIYSSFYYQDVQAVLQDADKGDIVLFHLHGFGGRVDTVQDLINNIHNTKAYVIMSVEAPVYSGHAYLAVNGNKLIMEKYSYLMFHYSDILNIDCNKDTGTDRGQLKSYHCQIHKNTEMYEDTAMILDMPVLTKQEKNDIFQGKDVYITADEYYKRYPHGV